MSFVTGVKHVTMATLLARTDMVLGDLEHVAFDPTGVDGAGNPTGYTSAGRYQYLVDGWNRLDGPDSHVVTDDFEVRDGDCYYVEHPTRVGNTNANTIDQVYTYQPGMVADTSTHTGFNSGTANFGPLAAAEVFQNNPDGSDTGRHGFGSGWYDASENSSVPGRVIIDFGEEVDIIGLEWQGEGNTGYTSPNGPAPISGPRGVTFRFSTTPFGIVPNVTTGDLLAFGYNCANLDWGANQSSPNGLAEYVDIRATNGGTPVRARYFAVDMDTSWDTRNMSVRHILFHHEFVTDEAAINATIDGTVQKFCIRDGAGNFAEGSRTDVVLGTDTIQLVRPGNYDFVRTDTGFRCYEGRELLAEGVV